MTDDKKTIFLTGFIPKALGEKDPEFVKGKGSINIDSLIKTLEECRQYTDNGWLNYKIYQSKKDPNKRYAQLDLWKPDNTKKELPIIQQKEPVMNVCEMCGQINATLGDNLHDCIPF